MAERIVVVGVGYVGLPLLCTFAGAGFQSTGVDINKERVELINKGICPVIGDEPGLSDLLKERVEFGNLRATTDYDSCDEADGIFVCVDTPIDEKKKPILDSLKKAVSEIGMHIKEGAMVSIESTIPPGTMYDVVIPLLENSSGLEAGKDFSVVHCPERVMPGRLLLNLTSYDRVLGGLDEKSIELGVHFYSSFMKGQLHPTDLLSAEITKTIENTYRDVQIAFANEVALACEKLGADAFEIRRLVNTCPFRDMHIPGAGVGGYCLPKDPWLFASSVPNLRLKLIPTAREINESMPRHMVQLIREGIKESGKRMRASKITILGLAFLRDSDDTRNSPAFSIIDALSESAELVVHDPLVERKYKVPLTKDLKEALKDSDCAVLVTDHSVYREMDLDFMRSLMRTPFIVDGRNVFNAAKAREKGFIYKGVGKGSV